MMMRRRKIVGLLLLGLIMTTILATACEGVLDANIATLNAAGTQAASGNIIDLPDLPDIPIGGEQGGDQGGPGEPVALPNVIDLRYDPNLTLAQGWAAAYSMPGGSEFTLIANEDQVETFLLNDIRSQGFQNTVRDLSAVVGMGQIRIDFAIAIGRDEDPSQQAGNGVMTFAPTLDGFGNLNLNPYPAFFGTLDIPGNLLTTVRSRCISC
jgi:hypothetical protein